MRSRRLCAEKPPNTTECVAPMRAQACMATTPSTDMKGFFQLMSSRAWRDQKAS